MRTRAAGLALGFAADRVFGDPARFHPVAGFGLMARDVERQVYRDDRTMGLDYTSVHVGGVAAGGFLAERVVGNRPVMRTLLTAATTWTALGGRSLSQEASCVLARLDADNLPAAREQLTHLVGRDPSTLDEQEISRAVVESAAENT